MGNKKCIDLFAKIIVLTSLVAIGISVIVLFHKITWWLFDSFFKDWQIVLLLIFSDILVFSALWLFFREGKKKENEE